MKLQKKSKMNFYVYVINKDKIMIKNNPLKAIVSVIPVEKNISQRKKDILKNVKNKYTVEIHKVQTRRRNYSLYRIDDYMVLYEEYIRGWSSQTLKFVSEEYQAQAEARKAE